MSRHYKVLTQITFTHTYYTGGVCGDFKVTPTAETAALLPKYHLIWGAVSKKRPGTYQLLREHIDTLTPLLPLPSAYVLRFEMELTKPALMNVTAVSTPNPALPTTSISKAINEVFVFENQTSGTGLTSGSYRKMELVGNVVRLSSPISGTVTVTEMSTNAFFTVTASSEGVYVNLEGKPVGIYRLSWTGGSKDVYFDPKLVGKGLFGILQLTQGGPLGLIVQPAYTQAFLARNEFWRYYVLLKGVNPGHNYEIEGSTAFGLAEDVTNGTSLDTFLASAMVASDIDHAMVFRSNTPIFYSEIALSSITLERVVSGDDEIVVKHLPNPAAGNPSAAVIVMVDPPV